MTGSPNVRRRRLDQAEQEPVGKGCLVAGAVLGVLVGAVLAFFGYPWVLRTFFAEEVVAPGGVYEGDAKVLRLLGYEFDPETRILEVRLSVRTNKTWRPSPDNFYVDVRGERHPVQALPPDPALPDTSLRFQLGEERTLLLRFRLPARDAVPEAIRLADPSVRFELSPP
ncbi:MAG: hypothetical protein RMK15_07265 [Chloroflexota bacterium]|nr:hypothetical protein [Dehalococcoidia bacterium]MDW8047060.1 hypothetical protein [Chloroflexota bacterium]